jgi:hypothetical protein
MSRTTKSIHQSITKYLYNVNFAVSNTVLPKRNENLMYLSHFTVHRFIYENSISEMSQSPP